LSLPPDDPSNRPPEAVPTGEPALTWERTHSFVPSGHAAENSAGQSPGQSPERSAGQSASPDHGSGELLLPLAELPMQSLSSPDPAWNGWDVARLVVLTIVALFAGVFAVLLTARAVLYPHRTLGDLAHVPLIMVGGQVVAYLLVLSYMYVLVTRERRRPDFFAAIHWNWPSNVLIYVLTGFVLSVALQALAHYLPIPKELPIDSFFQTPAEAWALGLLSMTLAPLMEELFFRAFLYPVLKRAIGVSSAIFLTALCFALLHGAQLMFSWGPVLVIFLVGMVITMVRAKTNSVAAGVIIHMAYNGTLTIAMFIATDGFRHLERLNQ
jgi:membrane protease YdiL (CAAX protease family)